MCVTYIRSCVLPINDKTAFTIDFIVERFQPERSSDYVDPRLDLGLWPRSVQKTLAVRAGRGLLEKTPRFGG